MNSMILTIEYFHMLQHPSKVAPLILMNGMVLIIQNLPYVTSPKLYENNAHNHT